MQNLKTAKRRRAPAPQFRSKPKSLKEAKAGDTRLMTSSSFTPTEKWPPADGIVSILHFSGGKFCIENGRRICRCQFSRIQRCVEPPADLCCYWFEKARISESATMQTRGWLATQEFAAARTAKTLTRIKNSGDIFFAISDREWILPARNVHV